VKNAELVKKSFQFGIDLAKANYYPNLSASAGVSTSYSGYQTSYSTSYQPGTTFGDQLKKQCQPVHRSVSFNSNISEQQVKTEVEVAKLI